MIASTNTNNDNDNIHKRIYDCVCTMSLTQLEKVINEKIRNDTTVNDTNDSSTYHRQLHTINDVYRDENGNTALHICARDNSKDMLTLLLLYYDGDVTDITNANDYSACNLAAQSGSVDIVKMLIEEGCHISLEKDIKDFCLSAKSFPTYKLLMLEMIERNRRASLLQYINNNLDIYQANLIEQLFPTEQTTPAIGWDRAWTLAKKFNESEISLLVERIVSKTYFVKENDTNDTDSSYVMLLNGRNNNKVQLITTILVPSILEYLGDYEREIICDDEDLNNCDTFSEWLDRGYYNGDDDYDDEYDGFDDNFDHLDDFYLDDGLDFDHDYYDDDDDDDYDDDDDDDYDELDE